MNMVCPTQSILKWPRLRPETKRDWRFGCQATINLQSPLFGGIVEDKRSMAYRQGIWVGLGLAVLTVIEFVISQVLPGGAVFLILIALIKAAIIVQYFMHVYRLWRAEEH